MLSLIGWKEKPQRYWHEFTLLKSSTQPYQMVGQDLITNQKTTYYKNQQIPTVTPFSLRYILEQRQDAKYPIESEVYLADGEKVYFKTQPLPLTVQDSPHWQSIRVFRDQYYLQRQDTGQMIFNDQVLAPENVPYTFLAWQNLHAHAPFLLSPKGIFVVNLEDKRLQRLANNPFLKQKIELSADIYHDGEHTYFLSYHRSSIPVKGGGSQTCYLRTRLIQLPKTPLSTWKEIADVYDRNIVVGQIWQYAQQYYYFDQQVKTDDAMYQIQTITTLNTLSDRNLGEKNFRKLLKDKELVQVKGKVFAEYKQRKSYCLSDLWDFS